MKSLAEALRIAESVSEELPDAEPAQKEEDLLDKVAKQAAEYSEIREQIKALEKQADALKAQFEPIAKPLAENGIWEHKGIQACWIEVKTQSVEPSDFYALAGEDGLQFVTVSVSKARKAIESGVLKVAKEQLDRISSFGSYERLVVRIVSAVQAAELFDDEIPF